MTQILNSGSMITRHYLMNEYDIQHVQGIESDLGHIGSMCVSFDDSQDVCRCTVGTSILSSKSSNHSNIESKNLVQCGYHGLHHQHFAFDLPWLIHARHMCC